jgi:hypothetical protein
VRCQRTGIVVFVSVNLVTLAMAERPIDPQPSDLLRIPANRIHGSVTEPLIVDLAHGIGPDEAAAIALFSNPALRSIRDRRGLASAQLIQAGILPNPVVSYEPTTSPAAILLGRGPDTLSMRAGNLVR